MGEALRRTAASGARAPSSSSRPLSTSAGSATSGCTSCSATSRRPSPSSSTPPNLRTTKRSRPSRRRTPTGYRVAGWSAPASIPTSGRSRHPPTPPCFGRGSLRPRQRFRLRERSRLVSPMSSVRSSTHTGKKETDKPGARSGSDRRSRIHSVRPRSREPFC